MSKKQGIFNSNKGSIVEYVIVLSVIGVGLIGAMKYLGSKATTRVTDAAKSAYND